MTAATTSSTQAWSLDHALVELRTPIGLVLMASAGIGVFMGAHWQPLVPIMLVFYFVTVLMPSIARSSTSWFVVAAVWAVAVVVRRSNMEDHVYLYLAWLVAIGVGLVDRETFMDEVGRQGRYLIAIVFGAATIWKLASMSFLSGAALWTIGLLDDRMGPLLGIAGISADSLDVARPQVAAVGSGQTSSFDIGLSTYSSAALLAVSLGTIALEALVAITHAVPDANRLARLRAPILVLFGIVTYAIVPVLPFALLLSVIGSTIARGDRRVMLAFGLMVLVTIVRFLTL